MTTGDEPLRPCLGLRHEPRCPELVRTGRCPDHQRRLDRLVLKAKREQRPYDHAERKRRADAVAEHIATRGYWCPGWAVPEHQATDLTADHITPVAAGGPEDGPLAVLCRPCNGRKGARSA